MQRAVRVQWVDSVGCEGWQHMSDVTENLMQPGSMDHVSVGLLIEETPDRILIALGSGANESETIHQPIVIPKCAITRLTDLEPRREAA